MTYKSPFVFVTSNAEKVREVQEILAVKVDSKAIHIPEIQAIDIDDVVRSKAELAYAHTNACVLVEDTGLYFDAWNGLPGALIKLFFETMGNGGICKMLGSTVNRGATAKCSFDIYDGRDHHLFSGIVRGTIAATPSGKHGFGWDPIFIPDGHERAFGEMTRTEKNAVSMRRTALEKLRSFVHGL